MQGLLVGGFEPYQTIELDPPWLERGGGRSKRGADRHYALADTPTIISVVLRSEPFSKLADSAHAWIWVTDNFLEDGLQLMRAMGFTYVRMLVWVKVRDVAERKRARLRRRQLARRRISLVRLQIGLGQYLRGSHEVCLFGTRGAAMVPPPARRRPSVVFAPRGRHSEKPAAAYAVFEAVSPGPRVSMFARASRPGWCVWGNEAPGNETTT